jgi:hypothetical protein
MAGATGLEPATFGVTGRRSKPTELRPRGRVAELNTSQAQVKAASQRPRSYGQIKGFAFGDARSRPVVGHFPWIGIEKTRIFRQ